jgi:hypothetical protein
VDNFQTAIPAVVQHPSILKEDHMQLVLVVLVLVVIVILVWCRARKIHYVMATLAIGLAVFAYHYLWWQSVLVWLSFGLVGLGVVVYNSGGTLTSQWGWCKRNPAYAFGAFIFAVGAGLITFCFGLQLIHVSKNKKISLFSTS